MNKHVNKQKAPSPLDRGICATNGPTDVFQKQPKSVLVVSTKNESKID